MGIVITELTSIYTYQTERVAWTNTAPRMVNILSYQLDGQYDHTFSFGTLLVKRNHVFTIGANDAYSVRRTEKGAAICVAFVSETPMCSELVDCSDDPRFAVLFRKLLAYRNLAVESNYYMALSVVYEILGLLRKKESATYLPTSKKSGFAEAQEYLRHHFYERDVDLTVFPKQLGISDKYFRETFRALYGSTPTQYLMSLRLGEAAKLLSAGLLSVSEVAETVGIPDVYYFSRLFKSKFSVPPSEFRDKKAD